MTTNKNPGQKKGGLATSLSVFAFWRKTIYEFANHNMCGQLCKDTGPCGPEIPED